MRWSFIPYLAHAIVSDVDHIFASFVQFVLVWVKGLNISV
jgi:hypothetical protein